METLLLTYSPQWRTKGATIQCGCGIYEHYTHSRIAHRYARVHALFTKHMTFVQDREFSLGKGDYILNNGQIEEPGDCC